MAFTVVADLADVDLAESATPWTSGSLDPAKYVQGSNSIGWYASKNTRSVNGVSSKSINWAAGDHLYWWMASDVAALMEAKTTGTTTASGVTIRVTLANGDFREWHIAGGDTWDGGWECFVVDLGHTGTELYASSGTFPDTSNITDVDVYYDLSNSGNIRNVPANCYADAIRVGTGLTAYNTSAADAAFDFADIAAVAEATAQAYGITSTIDGVIFLQGEITLGDGAGTNHLDFDSQDEVVVFSERAGSGLGIVAEGLYGVTVVGNATGTDQDFSMGVKVGTGDAAVGRNGTLILAGSSTVRYAVDWGDTDLHNVTLYGCTIRGAFRNTASLGVDGALSPTTTYELAGVTFDACGQVSINDAVGRNLTFLNTQAPSTSGALRWLNGTTDVEYSLFVNNTVAVEVVSLTADMTFVAMTFQGNTNDVRYEGATDWDLNWSLAASGPSVQNAGAGTLTPVNTVNTTIENVPTGAEWRLYEADATAGTIGTVELDGAESHTGGDITYADAYSADQLVALQVMASGFVEYLLYFTLRSTAQTIDVILIPETNT